MSTPQMLSQKHAKRRGGCRILFFFCSQIRSWERGVCRQKKTVTGPVVEKVYKAKQEHIFRHWNKLTKAQKKELLESVSDVDFEQVDERFGLLKNKEEKKKKLVFLALTLCFLFAFCIFFYKYVPLVKSFQLALAPILFIMLLVTAVNIRWGILFFVFAFPLRRRR